MRRRMNLSLDGKFLIGRQIWRARTAGEPRSNTLIERRILHQILIVFDGRRSGGSHGRVVDGQTGPLFLDGGPHLTTSVEADAAVDARLCRFVLLLQRYTPSSFSSSARQHLTHTRIRRALSQMRLPIRRRWTHSLCVRVRVSVYDECVRRKWLNYWSALRYDRSR